MQQFRVPKYLERESTVAFGLTFKKLAVLGALALAMFLFYYILPKVVFFLVLILSAALFFVFNFLKLQGRSVFEILTTSFSFFFSTRTYLWQKKEGLTPIKIVREKKKKEKKVKTFLKIAPKSRLGEIKSKIDLGPPQQQRAIEGASEEEI